MSAITRKTTQYQPDPDQDCGICHKPGAEVIWVGPDSRYAHRECVQSIERATSRLIQALNERFPLTDDPGEALKNNLQWSEAYSQAIRAIKRCCAPHSIRSFQDTHGEEALTGLFVAAEKAIRVRSRL